MLNKFRYILRKNYYRCFGEYDVTMEQLKNMQKEGTTVVDVRSPLEYKEGHIEGAILIPEYELKTNIENIIPNKIIISIFFRILSPIFNYSIKYVIMIWVII